MGTDRTIYLAIAELVRRYGTAHERQDDRGPLTRFELRCFSQHGEDGALAEILGRIGTPGRFFVEFGIETGREGNCVFLADVMGWNGVFIEPDVASFASLERKYSANPRVWTRNATVTPQNVELLFRELGVPEEPDVLSIDVDGPDYWIWQSLEAYRPRLVVIEYNALLAPGKRLVQPPEYAEPWDGTNYFGASLDALIALGERKGYRLVHCDLAAVNAFFVRRELGIGRFPALEEVPQPHEPNYLMTGHHHPPDPRSRRYIDPQAS